MRYESLTKHQRNPEAAGRTMTAATALIKATCDFHPIVQATVSIRNLYRDEILTLCTPCFIRAAESWLERAVADGLIFGWTYNRGVWWIKRRAESEPRAVQGRRVGRTLEDWRAEDAINRRMLGRRGR